ncbi:hypothetical protein Tco_0039285 [Tanacetum coccineum]
MKTFKREKVGLRTYQEAMKDGINNDDCVKSIFATGNTEARGTGIPVVLLNEDIMQTNAYKVYDVDFTKKEQITGESSVARKSLKITIKRKQPDLEAPISIAEQIDIENMTEAQQLSYTLAKSTKEAKAQENVKLIDPGSDKERPEVMNVDYVATIEEDEESAEAAIIRINSRN